MADTYYLKTVLKIGKSTVNNILCKELGFRYLKTAYKSNFLRKEEGILYCLCFIKTFVRCIKFGFIPIFIDETKIELRNNHLKCWRGNSETIYFGDSNKEKSNLILAVGVGTVFYYKITTKNANSEIFLAFLKELKFKISNNLDKKYILIIDNLTSHKDSRVNDYLVESKINVLFNAPYNSIFNAVEFCFRA